MLPYQHTPNRNIQSGELTNQAVKDEKEKGECNGVETLRLDPCFRADYSGVAAWLLYSHLQEVIGSVRDGWIGSRSKSS